MIKYITFILMIFACISTLYILYLLLPVFNLYFYDEDFYIFNLGSMLRHNPLAWINFEYLGWWRPLGFVLQAISYLIFGLSPLPHHIIGFAIHIITALSVAYFTRRLFSNIEAILAYIFYITAPFSVCLTGYFVVGYEDALSTCLVLFALGLQLRLKNADDLLLRGYWLSGLLFFLAALCKEIWIGFLPAVIFLDLVNYPKSTVRNRIRRLSVYVLPFIAILLRIGILGYSFVMTEQSKYINTLFSINNILKATTIPFLPESIPNNINVEVTAISWLRMLIPLVFIIISLMVINKKNSIKLLTLIVLYCSTAMIISLAPLNFYFVGWQHYIPVIAITSSMFALIITSVLNKYKHKTIIAIIIILCFTFTQICNHRTFILLIKELKTMTDENMRITMMYKEYFLSLPAGTHVFSYAYVRASELYNENIVPEGVKLTGFYIKERAHKRTDDYVIMGRKEIVKRELRKHINNRNSKFIIDSNGQIKDCRDMVVDILSHDYSYEDISYIIRKQRSQ